MSAAPRPTAAPGREQGHEFALEPLDFRGRHDHGRTAIDGVDDGDRFQVAVLDEGGRDAVGDPQPIRERDGGIADRRCRNEKPSPAMARVFVFPDPSDLRPYESRGRTSRGRTMVGAAHTHSRHNQKHPLVVLHL